MRGTIGDLYLTLAGEVLHAKVSAFLTAVRKLTGII